MKKVDINCDLGESYGAFKVGNDSKIMPHITSANVACGFHAGDPTTIAQTISLAKKYSVGVGAHPGFPDLMGFGRREMQLPPEDVRSYTVYQIGAIQGFTSAAGMKLQHVKAHGALYNMAVKDEKLSEALVEATRVMRNDLIMFAPPKSALAKASAKARLPVALEFFADRGYNADGSLVSRRQGGAIINDPHRVVERAVTAVKEGTVLSVDNQVVELGEVHTICVHGDTPQAVKLAEALRKGLAKAKVKVELVGKFI